MGNNNKLMIYTYTNKGSKELKMISEDTDNVHIPKWASKVSYTKDAEFKTFADSNGIDYDQKLVIEKKWNSHFVLLYLAVYIF